MASKKRNGVSRKDPPESRTVAAPNCVTIFGGGVAGLTAAHELVERGFTVQVWEPTVSERDPWGGCDVGGMARTQWSRVPWKEQADLEKIQPTRDAKGKNEIDWAAREAQPIEPVPYVFFIGPRGPAVDKYDIHRAISERVDAQDPEDIKKIVNEAAQYFGTNLVGPDEVVYCEVETYDPPGNDDTGRKRAKHLADRLNAALGKWKIVISETSDSRKGSRGPVSGDYTEHILASLIPKQMTVQDAESAGKRVELRIVFLDVFPDGLDDKVESRLSFRRRERWLPGEHGLHFFPAFYHHLFDTMKRTPILEPDDKLPMAAAQERSVTVNANPSRYISASRSVFDNIRPTSKQAIAFHNGRRPSVMSRSGPQSLEEIRDWLRTVLKDSRRADEARDRTPEEDLPGMGERYSKTRSGGLGLTARDIARFHLKTLQYMTSCDARRKEYETLTWFDYLGGPDKYSANFRNVVNDWPEALVAMDAYSSDARTQGSVFTQLLLDNVRPPGYRDGTLQGPVSIAWFSPWRRYLEAQGVEFIEGKITGFVAAETNGGNVRVWPKVECYEPRYPDAINHAPQLMPGYFLLALPAQEAQNMANELFNVLGEAAKKEDAAQDAARLNAWTLLQNKDDLYRGDPSGALRHMVGIQYYFDEDVYWLDGHFYFPLSDWGLSAISQARFWEDKQDWEHGYRGILSVVFTEMNKKATSGPVQGKAVWDCTSAEIAAGVWAQVKEAFVDQAPPEPRYWHLDLDLEPLPLTGVTSDPGNRKKGYYNAAPLIINLPGEYARRPGDLIEIKRIDEKLDETLSKYKVFDGVVFAGTYMKTFTRLTCMEASNESARHAVNAIIQHARDNQLADEPVMRSTPCDIWPIELREVDDFQFLKDLDAELYERELDHFVEILGIDELVTNAHRGSRPGIDDPFDPLYVMTEIDRFAKRVGDGFISALKNTPSDKKGRAT